VGLRCAWGSQGFWIGNNDREVDHGEEVEGEEEIREEEKEGRSSQKEEDAEGIEKEGGEEDSQKGGTQA
jgi:hypothetical protein